MRYRLLPAFGCGSFGRLPGLTAAGRVHGSRIARFMGNARSYNLILTDRYCSLRRSKLGACRYPGFQSAQQTFHKVKCTLDATFSLNFGASH
jgi:hypothetical protein